jgi:hypothetical protein
MSDLHLGETCTYTAIFQSFGTAHTFTFPYQVDKVEFYNLTQWAAVDGNIPHSIWWRNQTAIAQAYQEQAINAAGTKYNFLDTVANGFTVANIASGAPAYRALISGISSALPAVVTTSAPNNFQTGQIVRFTDLGDDQPVPHGASDLNNKRARIVVLSTTTFAIYDPITDDPIAVAETYITGGRVDVESRVISLNNPQQPPYALPNAPYIPNPFVYNPEVYQLTAGTAVMGNSGDVFRIEAIRYGTFENLGTFTS